MINRDKVSIADCPQRVPHGRATSVWKTYSFANFILFFLVQLQGCLTYIFNIFSYSSDHMKNASLIAVPLLEVGTLWQRSVTSVSTGFFFPFRNVKCVIWSKGIRRVFLNYLFFSNTSAPYRADFSLSGTKEKKLQYLKMHCHVTHQVMCWRYFWYWK